MAVFPNSKNIAQTYINCELIEKKNVAFIPQVTDSTYEV